MLATVGSIVLALAAQNTPQVLAQAGAAPSAPVTSILTAAPSNEALLCENIRLWHRDIVFQMALSLAVGVPPVDQPRTTAVQALSQAQQALLDRVQEVYETSCRSGGSAEP